MPIADSIADGRRVPWLPTLSRSSSAGSRWTIFAAGVLDDVGGEFAGDLLGDDQTLAVGPHLGQHGGEHLHGVGGRARGARLGPPEQAVCLLDHGEVGQAGPRVLAQVLGQSHEDGPHEEGLVRVVAEILDLQHDIVAAQRVETQRVAALEEPAQTLALYHTVDEALTAGGNPLSRM